MSIEAAVFFCSLSLPWDTCVIIHARSVVGVLLGMPCFMHRKRKANGALKRLARVDCTMFSIQYLATLDLGVCIHTCFFRPKFFVKRQNQSTSVTASSLGLCKSLQTIE